MMHSSNSTTQQQSNTSNTQSTQHLQLNLSSNQQPISAALMSSSTGNMPSHGNVTGHGKSLAQMPPLSAVAYSHLHSVMGSMPIYDMSDYQHL